MIGLSKGLLLRSLGIILAMGVCTASQGQGCRVYEREMEHLFLTHEPQTPVPQQELERIRARCPEPSQKMLLIYYFFRAVDSYQSPQLSDQEAYEQAVTYYNRAARHFVYLTELELDDPFFDAFYRRAEELEYALQDMSYQMGYNTRQRQPAIQPTSLRDQYQPSGRVSWNARTRGETATRNAPMEMEWTRENLILPTLQANSATNSSQRRGSSAPSVEWERGNQGNQRRSGNQQNARYGQPRGLAQYPGAQFVGTISDLDFVDYLRFRGTPATAAQRRADPMRGSEANNPSNQWSYRYAPPSSPSQTNPSNSNARISNAASVAANSNLLVNAGSQTPLSNRPGPGSPTMTQLGFGEAVTRVPESTPIFQQGVQYVQVQTVNGQVGWVPSDLMVADGRIAVVIEATQAAGPQGGLVEFQVAEPVILARFDQASRQALVVGQDEKSGWVANLEALSINQDDLEIADLIQEAMNQTSLYARRAKLYAIQRHPAYSTSPLSSAVVALLQEEGR